NKRHEVRLFCDLKRDLLPQWDGIRSAKALEVEVVNQWIIPAASVPAAIGERPRLVEERVVRDHEVNAKRRLVQIGLGNLVGECVRGAIDDVQGDSDVREVFRYCLDHRCSDASK